MSDRMPRVRVRARALAALASVLVVLAGAGCAASADREPTAFVTPAPPGGGSGTDDAAAAARSGTPDDSETTPADLAFMQAMIEHHEQAVELTALAPGRATDAELTDLAARMHEVQAAEAEAMRSWAERRASRASTSDDHAHDQGMPGEISRSTIDRAAALDGASFDALFIGAMAAHHRGAVRMAEDRLAEAGDPAVSRWARAIATSQSLEIDRLVEIEARLAG